LGGGSKKRQQQDIATAKVHWADYKERIAALKKKAGTENKKK
jgi:hypothetical protein